MTTSPLTLWNFFPEQLRMMAGHGIEVHAITSPGVCLDWFRETIDVQVHPVSMHRRIAPWGDFKALLAILRVLLRIRPDIIHTHTPKAGLLGMIAGFVLRVPKRIYTIHGLVFMTQRGWKRRLLIAAEGLACKLATDVLCVSRSMRVVAIACDLCPPIKVRVLGAGSVSGVDLRRFSPARAPAAFREEVRRQFGIPADATVITFVGRIVRDKGIVELAAAWSQLRCQFPGLWLLICGAAESEDPVPQVTLNTLHSDPRVRCTGAFVQDVFPVFAATDICVLPSYREGLGNVVLESAAMGIPTVATRIPGCIDAVVDGVTGLLVEPRCPEALAAAIAKLAADTALRQKLGDAARRRVERAFSQVQVSEAILSEYKRLLGERGSSVQEKVWHAEA